MIPKLILASSSPYRRELLTKLGLQFQSISPEIDESSLINEAPQDTALRLAKLKAKKIAEKYTIKNISSFTHKTATFNSLKSSLVFKGFSVNTPNADVNSNYIKFNKGNISYIIPYRYHVVLSKFKTPSPVQP